MSTRTLIILSLSATLALPVAAWAVETASVQAHTAETAATEVSAIEAPADVMALPSELRARLHDAVLDDDPPRMARFERLIDFMFDPRGLGMTYRENATHSVRKSYLTREANCVGFTLLFLALAREAGLDASAQGVRRTLSWRQGGRTLYLNRHVNALVRIGTREYVVDFAIEPVIAHHRPTPISDRSLLAHYYNNLAMQDLEEGRMASAQRLIAITLSLDATSAANWSNAGVVHLRDNDAAGAERAYAKALALDPRDTGALFNMASLARRNGDSAREAELRRRLARVQKQDPLHHFLLAMAFEHDGNYPQAIDFYRNAIRLHGGEHRFHAALARAYRLSGNQTRAAAALKHAAALSEGVERDRYRQQLWDLHQAAN